MTEKSESKNDIKKFAGIEIPPDITQGNFFFLYLNTLMIGIMMSVPAIVQPAFLTDVIKINQDFAGSINGLLQNMSQIATIAFVALIGVLSDNVGRKILAFIGFLVLAISFYLLTMANGIASTLHLPAGLSAQICALLSFVPSETSEFIGFAPGLFITYIIRFIIGVGLILVFPQFITMVADYTYEKDRGKGMAMNGVMIGLASIIVFAVLSPVLARAGVTILIYIIAAVALVGGIFTGLFLKDRMPESRQDSTGLKEIVPVVKKSISLKASYLCCLVTRADIVVLATFLVTWGVKYGKALEMEAQTATLKASLPMIIMGVASLAAFPILGVLLDKWGRVEAILLSLISGGIAMVLLAISPNPFSILVYVAMIFVAVGMAGAITGANTLASDASPKGMVGSILGGLNTMQPIGILFFVGVGGYLFDKIGPGAAFALKGFASLLLGVWFFMIKGTIKKDLQHSTSLDRP